MENFYIMRVGSKISSVLLGGKVKYKAFETYGVETQAELNDLRMTYL